MMALKCKTQRQIGNHNNSQNPTAKPQTQQQIPKHNHVNRMNVFLSVNISLTDHETFTIIRDFFDAGCYGSTRFHVDRR